MKAEQYCTRYAALFLVVILVITGCGTQSLSTVVPPSSTATPLPTLPATPTFAPTSTATIASTPTVIPISGTFDVVALAAYDVGIVAGSAFSPDGKSFATGKEDGTIALWDAGTGKEISTLSGHTGLFPTLDFSTDGSLLAFGSEKGDVIIWNIASGAQLHSLKADSPFPYVEFSPDGKTLVSIDQIHLILWNISTGERLRTLQCTDTCGSVAFSPDGRVFAVSSFGKKLESTIVLRDSTTGELVLTFNGKHITQVFSMAFSADGKWLASGDRWDFIRIWNVETGELLSTFNSRYNDPTGGGPSEFTRGIDVGGGVDALAFSPDSRTLASGHNDGPIVLWNIAMTQPLQVLEHETYTRGFARNLTSLSFSSDGSLLMSGRRNSLIIVWGIKENLTRYPAPLFP